MSYHQKFLMPFFVLCAFTSCKQSGEDFYNFKDYQEVFRGKYKGTDLYAITFQNRKDNNYVFIKIFNDSACNTEVYTQHFEYGGVVNGPSETFMSGKLGSRQFYKDGKLDGEAITYANSLIAQRKFYQKGKKVGAWEYYDSYGRLYKKVYYENDKFSKQEIYDQNGKLVRREIEESLFY